HQCLSIRSFFFFQAEDGIRDRNVTGVQTCALPISASEIPKPNISPATASLNSQSRPVSLRACTLRATPIQIWCILTDSAVAGARSEERRVGKECRCGWGR